MSRLTKTLRENMLKAVLAHAFNEKETAAEKAKRDAGEKIYADIYSKHLIAMESLPKGWLEKSSAIEIAVSGQRHRVYLNESRLIGRGHDGRYSMPKLYVGDEQVVIDYLETVSNVDAIKKQRSNMSHEVQAILESATTFKKLWEIWPESKCILEKFETKPTVALLPAIQIEKVNSALGLPTDKGVAA